MFKSFEPYPTGNGYSGGGNEFVALSKLANSTKHAVALTAIPRFDIASLAGTGGLIRIFMRWGEPDRVGFWDNTKNELTVGLFKADFKVELNLQITSLIAFDDVEPFKDLAAGEILSAYTNSVDTIIVQLERAVN